MVNSNAARHLLLIVSILLCFFVYMGYRIWGQPENGIGDSVAVPIDLAELNPGKTSGNANLVTVNETPSSAPSTVRAPIITPSGQPPSQGGREEMPEFPARSNVPDRGGSLKPPGGESLMPPPPSGSLEESTVPNNPAGQITGLVPAPPLKPPEAAVSNEPASAAGLAKSTPPAPAPQTGSGGGLKPPGSGATSPLLPPPASNASPAARSDSNRDPERNTTSASGSGDSDGFLAPPPPPGPGLTPPRPTRTPAAAGGASGGGRGSPATGSSPSALTGNQANPSAGTGAAFTGSESLRVYIIRPGDTLSRIAARELGSNALANNIFLLNRDVISDPDQLLVGERILLPVRENQRTTPAVTPDRPTPPSPPGFENAVLGGTVRVHRVARGDTLSSIALRYYGSSAGWRFLYESNSDVIANPNQLTVGTELVVPPYGDRR